MQRACYQAKDAHIADHLKRLEDLSSLAMQIESKLQYCAQDVYSYFRAWLSDHIFNYDIPMVQAFHLVGGTVE
jgi:hemerythrin